MKLSGGVNFNLYINDLVAEIKKLEDKPIPILLYADDIEWKLVVNADKSQILHFRRGPSVPRSAVKFKCGGNDLQTVDRYRYLE